MQPNTSWMMSLNRHMKAEYYDDKLVVTNGLPYGKLPEHIQECLVALWKNGVMIEVWGVKSQQWQPHSQCDFLPSSSKYYRLQGAAHCAVHKPRGQKGQYVFVHDPKPLPENTVVYTASNRALAVQLTPY